MVQERLKNIGHNKGPIIQIIREVTKELWDKEDEATRDVVTAQMAEKGQVEDEGEDKTQRTPEQYQK